MATLAKAYVEFSFSWVLEMVDQNFRASTRFNKRSFLSAFQPECPYLTLVNVVGAIIVVCQKILISPKPNIRWTSSLSMVQQRKPRPLYLSRCYQGGQTKFENPFFQITKLRFSVIFADKISDYQNKISKRVSQVTYSSHLITYINPY